MAALPQQQTAMQAVPMDVDASSSSPLGDSGGGSDGGGGVGSGGASGGQAKKKNNY